MKILSRILVTFVVLLGVAFLAACDKSGHSVIQSRAQAATNAKCQGQLHIQIGLDENGCPTKEPLQATEDQLDEWLKNVSKDCYKIHIWKDHVKVKEKGNLAAIECVAKAGAQPLKPQMLQPTGSGSTQHIWFNTATAKTAFEKQMQAAKPKRKKK